MEVTVEGEEEKERGANDKRKNTLSETWPRLTAVIKVTVIMVMMRFIFLLLSVLFSTILNSNGETSQEYIYPPNDIPSPFVSAHPSLIIDINNGSMNTLNDVLRNVDVAMVMMYAPWCLHSKMAAKHFIDVATKFGDIPNIRFIGVNCWEVMGSCRHQEGLTVYPRLMAYRVHNKDRIEYFGKRSYLESFVKDLLYPMVYITSVKQLKELVAYEESLVIGYFNFSSIPFPPGYISYYLASVQAIKTDPLNGLRRAPIFGIISSKALATNLLLSPSPCIYYITITHTKGLFTKVQYKGPFSSDKIFKWSLSLTKVVKRLAPVGNMSLYPTSAVLFLRQPETKSIISNFNQAAVTLSSSPSSTATTCKGYDHLSSSWACLSPSISNHLTSLPLCSDTPQGKCPIFNPLFPNLYYPIHSNTSYCQDDREMGMAYGGWPLPCDSLSLQFYIIDDLQYTGLRQSVGVVTDTPTLLISDLKNRKVFNFSIDDSTSPQDYITMIESSIKGQGSLVYRSSTSFSTHSSSDNCCIELNTHLFSQLLLDTDKVFLVVHYAPWCVVCTHVWPQLMALSQRVNTSVITLTRINGELNDLPKCHVPTYYPSIALYSLGRKHHHPIWFPSNHIINVNNMLDFINAQGGVVNEGVVNEWAEEDVSSREQWDSMGWLLWETTERERQSLLKTNQLLNNEIKQLRHQLQQSAINERRRGEGEKEADDMNSLLAQVDNLIGNIMKYSSTPILSTSFDDRQQRGEMKGKETKEKTI